jgi:hypothetical protein
MSRTRTHVLGGVSRRLRSLPGLGADAGVRTRSLVAGASVVSLYRPLSDLSAVLGAATGRYAPVVVGVLLCLAAIAAVLGVGTDAEDIGTLGAALVGATLLATVVAVAEFGRLGVLGPGALAVGALATVATAALTVTVAVWTIRAARSCSEGLAFGTAAAFPVLAGPWFAAFAPEAVPAVGTGGAGAVLAVAAGLTLSVGVAHGAYRLVLARARIRPNDLVEDRERSDGV